MTKRTFTVAFLATIAVAAIAAAFGHPVSIEGLASLGMFPLVTGEVEVSDIFATLKKQGDEMTAWRKKQDGRFAEIDAFMNEIATKQNRPRTFGGDAESEHKTAFVDYIRTGDLGKIIGAFYPGIIF